MSVNWRWLLPCLLLVLVAAGMFVWQGDIQQLWSRLVYEIALAQRGFHRELIAALKAIEESGWWVGTGVLAGLSFLYGVFHAAGPGHGKAVLSAWLLTHPSLLRKGIMVAFLAALAQGVTAIVVIYGLFSVLGLIGLLSSDLVPLTEQASYILVILVGFWLLQKGLQAWPKSVLVSAHDHHHDHDHDHHHDHEHCATCGHAHMPSPKEIATKSDWREQAGMILSIGLRPCSGALIVLTLAKSLSWDWAGIVAVIAMSIGTGLATSILAACAVFFRQFASHLILPGSTSANGAKIESVLRMGGAFAIVLLGIVLLQASLSSGHPLGL